MTRWARLSTIGAVAAALGLTACGAAEPGATARATATATSTPSAPASASASASTAAARTEPVGHSSLARFVDCDDLAAHLHRVGPAHAAANGPYADDNPFRGDVRTSDTPARLLGAGPDVPPAPPEPGAAATDGRLLVTAFGGRLNVVDVSGRKPRLLGGVDLPEHGHGGGSVALVGARVLLISSADPVGLPEGLGPPGTHPPAQHRSELTLVDVADPARPTILSTETITGRVVATRRTGDVLRIVLVTDPGTRLARTGIIGTKRNRVFVEHTTAADWLPDRQITDGQGGPVTSGPLVACADVRRPTEDSGLEVLTVLTVDPARDDALATAGAVGVLAGGDLVASSPTRLFVATIAGWGKAKPGPAPRTQVHAFDLTSATETRYLGSGEMADYVAGVGALSAREHTIRAITTKNPPWNRPYTGRKDDVGVAVLAERDGTLRSVGSLTGLAEGRRWKVLRWFDDLVAVAPDPRIPSNSSSSEEAGPFDLVALDEAAGPRRVRALDLPQRTALLIAIGGDRVVGVGLRSGLKPMADTSLEVISLDLGGPGGARPSDLVSFGRGSVWGAESIDWLPERRLLILQGYIDPYRGCPAGVRCLLSPVQQAYNTSAVSLHVDPYGRLRPVGWYGDPRSPGRLLRVGDRFAAVSDRVALIDPETLATTGSVDLPTRESR